MTRVLVVEDNPRTAEELRAALGDHGFIVDCAGTGRDGMLKAAAEPYGAIVLDRMLPAGRAGRPEPAWPRCAALRNRDRRC